MGLVARGTFFIFAEERMGFTMVIIADVENLVFGCAVDRRITVDMAEELLFFLVGNNTHKICL